MDRKEDYQIRKCLFAMLYEDYQEPIERYLVKWVHDQESARDLCQETFAYFWKFLLTKETIVQPAANYVGRIYKTAQYRAIDYLRRKKPTGYLSMLDSEADAPELMVESDEDRICDLDSFWGAVAHLPLEQQECLLLKSYGHKQKEIAAMLGISPSRVSEILSDVKTQLQSKCYQVPVDLRHMEVTSLQREYNRKYRTYCRCFPVNEKTTRCSNGWPNIAELMDPSRSGYLPVNEKLYRWCSDELHRITVEMMKYNTKATGTSYPEWLKKVSVMADLTDACCKAEKY